MATPSRPPPAAYPFLRPFGVSGIHHLHHVTTWWAYGAVRQTGDKGLPRLNMFGVETRNRFDPQKEMG